MLALASPMLWESASLDGFIRWLAKEQSRAEG